MGGYFPTLPVPPGNGDKMALKHKTTLSCVSPQRRRSLSNLHFASGLDRLQWYSLDFPLTFGVAVISAAQTTEPLTFQPMRHYQIDCDCEPRLRLKMLPHCADSRGKKCSRRVARPAKSPLAFKSLQRKLSTQTERPVEGVQWADYRKQCSSVSFVIIRRPSSIPGDTRSPPLLKESHSPLQSRGAAVWHLERGCTSAAIIGSRQQVWTSSPKNKTKQNNVGFFQASLWSGDEKPECWGLGRRLLLQIASNYPSHLYVCVYWNIHIYVFNLYKYAYYILKLQSGSAVWDVWGEGKGRIYIFRVRPKGWTHYWSNRSLLGPDGWCVERSVWRFTTVAGHPGPGRQLQRAVIVNI